MRYKRFTPLIMKEDGWSIKIGIQISTSGKVVSINSFILSSKEAHQKGNEKYIQSHKEQLQTYYHENKKKKAIRNKLYRENHKEAIKNRAKDYYQTHKKEIENRVKKYELGHKKEIKERGILYSQKHKNEIKKYKKEYFQIHREEIYSCHQKYGKTLKGQSVSRQTRAKRRELDFIELNEWFEGSHAHHIDKEFVLYIPKELHRSVYHNVWTKQGMEEINNLAFEYAYGVNLHLH